MHKILFLFVILVCFSCLPEPYPDNELLYNDSIHEWHEETKENYSDIYTFETSGNEWQIAVFIDKRKVCAQVITSTFSSRLKKSVKTFSNLTGVRIKNGVFYSDQYVGRFVYYEEKKALRVKSNAPASIIETGLSLGENKFHVYGNYPNGRLRYLHTKELEGLSEHELSVMKNEIFARYGFIFKSGSRMDKYFRNQNWYVPAHSEVSNFLTDIERANIRRLERINK